MQSIEIICVGKLKESFFRDGCTEYEKRLNGKCKLTITELPEQRLPDKPSEKQIAAALEAEGNLMLGRLSPGCYAVALCVEGKGLDSTQIAETILCGPSGLRSHVVFFIGSSFGLSPSVKKEAHMRLSFSLLTFPHQLMRLFLLEQLYRGHQILLGSPYHK